MYSDFLRFCTFFDALGNGIQREHWHFCVWLGIKPSTVIPYAIEPSTFPGNGLLLIALRILQGGWFHWFFCLCARRIVHLIHYSNRVVQSVLATASIHETIEIIKCEMGMKAVKGANATGNNGIVREIDVCNFGFNFLRRIVRNSAAVSI